MIRRALESPGRLVLWAVALAAAGVVCWIGPWPGPGFRYVKWLNLGLASAAVAILAARHRRRMGAAAAELALGLLALVAVTGYTNFLTFHGDRTFVHLHDVAHYYLGAKYFDELGYDGLYTAMLRAEAETEGDRFLTIEARDLETYERVHIRRLLSRSDAVKDAFTPERWAEFKQDAGRLRERLGPHYAGVLLDHGFNPTPVWALLGGAVAGLVPAGSDAGILALCLIDPVLLLAAFGLVGWAYGRPTAVLAVLHFSIVFGANFGWTGGAFGRHVWFFGVVAAACCLKRGRPGLAGAALGLAGSLRIFPLFLALPLLFKGVHAIAARVGRADLPLLARLTPPRATSRFLAALGMTVAILVGSTAALDGGLERWAQFRRAITTHVASISPNVVGLTELLAWKPAPESVSADEFAALKQRRQRIHATQALLVFAPLVVIACVASRRLAGTTALALGVPLAFAAVSLAAYYYVVLGLLVLAFRARSRELAWIFAAEAVPHAFLGVAGDADLCLIRGLVLVPLFVALFVRRRRRPPGLPTRLAV